ncbi:hypothetical protein TNCV_2811061 [Trichonephila clavipes]|nr:hypothetical protein TNCV_2811061 [Trichonephila clavipes]
MVAPLARKPGRTIISTSARSHQLNLFEYAFSLSNERTKIRSDGERQRASASAQNGWRKRTGADTEGTQGDAGSARSAPFK